MKNPFKKIRCDASKWGISDLYEDAEEALKAALRSEEPFDTDWYGCKKEIQSGRISRSDGKIQCYASVSDDFDTPGMGKVEIEELRCRKDVPDYVWDYNYGRTIEALEEALTGAAEDQKDNREYAGFSVHEVNEDGSAGSWIETYILAIGPYGTEFPPPGDYYQKWGWQNDGCYPIPIPEETRAEMENWALDLHYRMAAGHQVPAAAKQVGNLMMRLWED